MKNDTDKPQIPHSWTHAEELMIEDMTNVIKTRETFMLHIGLTKYSPQELIEAIKARTELGCKLVGGYIDGLHLTKGITSETYAELQSQDPRSQKK